ncbi:MAG TPA: glycosyltransferase family 1 protein [Chloroflexi bacterium]|nr:glycosyltransferase family 1 protein [Chloroflexota bacterium]
MSQYQTRTHKIGLNALLLGSGTKGTYRQAGIHNYIDGLLSQFKNQDQQFLYKAFVCLDNVNKYHELVAHQVPNVVNKSPITRILWEQFVLPTIVMRNRLDLLHGMAFVTPILSVIPTIVTVYDLSFLRFPRRINRTNRLYLSLFTRISCVKARRIIAISEHTKQDVVSLLGVKKNKVDVIYPGLHGNFKRASEISVAKFRERRGLPERFILYLGTIEPRKNLSVLIHAYNKIQPTNVKLICVGDKGWLYKEVFQIVEELHLGRDVMFPGFVPQDELTLWYSACSVFVYPSAYEGFGLPVLEAMACGAITITSDAASLPEVAGKASVLIPPDDVDILADCIDDVLNTKGKYVELCNVGPKQAARFSWKTAGRLTERSYTRALGLTDMQQSIDSK